MPDPFKDAPRPLRDKITKFAGLNPYGLPNWRVCLAQHCTQILGGIFHTMPDGELSIVDEEVQRDGSVKLIHREIHPEKVEHSNFMVMPKYPHEGWILEIWMPAHLWGSRSAWESHMSDDGITPLMGPYPEEGDYWMLDGPWDHAPEISAVEQAIAQYNWTRRNRPVNLENHMRQVLKDAEEKKMRDREARAQRYIELMEKEIKPLMQSMSLSAQRLRNSLQQDLRQSSHLAAGDF